MSKTGIILFAVKQEFNDKGWDKISPLYYGLGDAYQWMRDYVAHKIVMARRDHVKFIKVVHFYGMHIYLILGEERYDFRISEFKVFDKYEKPEYTFNDGEF